MICKNCVLDDSISDITFDDKGICHYCAEYKSKAHIFKTEADLHQLIHQHEKKGRYDCIVGISGGLDSSYLLYKVKQMGLSPLAVNVDSGWNTETAVANIEQVTTALDIDLHTLVVDWENFKQLQLAYLRSGVIDLEIPTDHVYLAGLYKAADEYGITLIFTGNNLWSEGIMPRSWIHNKGDITNMLDIFKKNSDYYSLKGIPVMGLAKKFYYYNIKKIENVFLLNYINYNREEAKSVLVNELNWKEFAVKHGETIYTRFYHRYILPKRFKVDIRKAHLSALICNGQLKREKALELLSEENYPEETLRSDLEYILKKFGLSKELFGEYMSLPVISHYSYKTDDRIKKLYNKIRKFTWLKNSLAISNRT